MTTLNQLFPPAEIDMPDTFLRDADGGATMRGVPVRIVRQRFNRFPIWAKMNAERRAKLNQPATPEAAERKESFLDRRRRAAGMI